jgi:predicted MPP superfamily phosphohydrolase
MKNILIISDMHVPYHHPDAIDFLRALHKKYKFELIKNAGDLVDNHSGSFHQIEYGTLSAKEEHEQAVKAVQELYKLFPKMTVILGNHGSMTYRKAKMADIPLDHIKSYNDIYGTKGWKWTDKDFFAINRNEKVLLVHSMSSNTLNNAARHSFNSAQGHHHGKYGIEYFADCEQLRWSMTTGCLIDFHSPAFNYARHATMNRPILGCGGIIDGMPRLFPMRLNKKGRWDKIVP